MPKNILVPVDISTLDSSAVLPLQEALKMLGPDGTLHVLSVIPDLGMAQVSGYFRKGFEKEMLHTAGETLTQFVNDHVPASVDVHPHVVNGTVYDQILKVSDRLGIDIIVMGAHRPDLSDYLLGPNAARVVRHAKQSVYVVRN